MKYNCHILNFKKNRLQIQVSFQNGLKPYSNFNDIWRINVATGPDNQGEISINSTHINICNEYFLIKLLF